MRLCWTPKFTICCHTGRACSSSASKEAKQSLRLQHVGRDCRFQQHATGLFVIGLLTCQLCTVAAPAIASSVFKGTVSVLLHPLPKAANASHVPLGLCSAAHISMFAGRLAMCACRFGRRRPFLSAVGRLDKDTSGLLLLTDDGQLLHSIQSPAKGM